MSARPIRPTELLRCAGDLAGIRRGRGRPRTTDLRRAISTAYYAVFHELAQQCTTELTRDGVASADTAAAVGRWIGHTDLKAVAGAVTGTGNPALRDVLGGASRDLRFLTDAFVELQDARELADYDNAYDVSKAVAVKHVRTAMQAVATARGLAAARDPTFVLFLRLMVGSVKVARKH